MKILPVKTSFKSAVEEDDALGDAAASEVGENSLRFSESDEIVDDGDAWIFICSELQIKIVIYLFSSWKTSQKRFFFRPDVREDDLDKNVLRSR